MRKKLIGITLLMIVIALLGACGTEKNKDSTENEKIILGEAEKLVEDKLLTSYKQMGIDIEQYEINNAKLVEQVPYSEGGNFNFYEISIRLKPEKPEQIEKIEKRDNIKFTKDKEGWITKNSGMGRIFISAYDDGKELYEILWLREMQLPKTKEGDLDFSTFVGYHYEQIIPVIIQEEYSFKFDENRISIGDNYKGKLPLENAEVKREDIDGVMSGIARYKELWNTKEICLETYSYFEKHYEPILRMVTFNNKVETNRGIMVGSTEEELFDAYGIDKLIFSSSSFGGEWFNSFAEQENILKENEEWTCYGFTGEDDTQNYIVFYMKEGKVIAIEMGTGVDYKPFVNKEGKYTLELEDFINDHIDEPNVMKYDVVLPKIKDSVIGSGNLNALIQLDFQQIIEYSQKEKYEPGSTGFTYPWIDINYSISDLGEVEVLNIFTTYSSALGSGADRFVNSYYYDTSCGARLSEEAALYKLGFTKDNINRYLAFLYPEFVEEAKKNIELFNNVSFYFHETGEPRFIINGDE